MPVNNLSSALLFHKLKLFKPAWSRLATVQRKDRRLHLAQAKRSCTSQRKLRQAETGLVVFEIGAVRTANLEAGSEDCHEGQGALEKCRELCRESCTHKGGFSCFSVFRHSLQGQTSCHFHCLCNILDKSESVVPSMMPCCSCFCQKYKKGVLIVLNIMNLIASAWLQSNTVSHSNQAESKRFCFVVYSQCLCVYFGS